MAEVQNTEKPNAGNVLEQQVSSFNGGNIGFPGDGSGKEST